MRVPVLTKLGKGVSRFYMNGRKDLTWEIELMTSGAEAWVAYETRKDNNVHSYAKFYYCYDISKKELRIEKLKKLNCDI